MNSFSLSRPIVFFDLETTGINYQSDRIVEISCLKMWPDGGEELLSMLLNPEMPIPAEASAVHGISNDAVAGQPAFADAAAEIHAFFKGADIGGYNCVTFDLPFMKAEFGRCGMAFPEPEAAVVDVYTIYTSKVKNNLSAAYRYYTGKQLEGSHRAENDIRATAEIFLAQVGMHSDIGQTVEEISRNMRTTTADPDGRLFYDKDGRLCFNFGKNNGKPVLTDREYAAWILDKDFPEATKALIRKELGLATA